ncbi:MAG: PspC domain-containing protein [Bacteriovoracaceae bacterium]|nr:PspC domain-containing protein [Bacteroidota bacterium]
MNNQKLYRSQTNKIFAGVCGGLAEYFDVDPVVIRILFVLMVLFGGTGIILYIAAIFIVPKKPIYFNETPPLQSEIKPGPRNETVRNWFGFVIVIIGVFLLLANLEVFHVFDFLTDTFEFIFPVLLIILGMAIIYYRQSQSDVQTGVQPEGQQSADQPFQPTGFKHFRRSIADKKIFGVCGGLAQYFGIDSSLIRMLYVVLCLASFGAGLVLYILIALIVPYDNIFTSKVS